MLSMPHSRPMPSIGPRCHELRINDADGTWRIIYRIDRDAIVIAEVFAKKTQKTPDEVVRNSQRRLKEYDDASRQAKESGSQGLEGRRRKGLPRTH
jgi:phage-related protein